MIHYLVIYTNSTTQPSLRENGPVRGWGEASTERTACHPTLIPGHTLFFALLHFALVIHFLNGCLDGLLVAQELVRPNGMQVLIQLQQNRNSSGQSDFDNILI